MRGTIAVWAPRQARGIGAGEASEGECGDGGWGGCAGESEIPAASAGMAGIGAGVVFGHCFAN